jgi:hypothetical protein
MGEIFMAQRIATEYKQIQLELTNQQLQAFINFFKAKNFPTEVRVFDNGDTEFILFDKGSEIPLAFRNIGYLFHYEGSYVIKDTELASTMQKAVHDFKGHALVHRIYDNYVMEYHYQYGNVTKIIERKSSGSRLVFEYNDPALHLSLLFAEQGVEDEIAWIKLQIDMLLDQRTRAKGVMLRSIDEKLRELTKELFIAEA